MKKFRTIAEAEASGWKMQCDDGRWIAWVPNSPTYDNYVEVLSEEENWLLSKLESIAGQVKETSNATVRRMGGIAQSAIDEFLEAGNAKLK